MEWTERELSHTLEETVVFKYFLLSTPDNPPNQAYRFNSVSLKQPLQGIGTGEARLSSKTLHAKVAIPKADIE